MPKAPKLFLCLALCAVLLCGCFQMPETVESELITVNDLTISMPAYFENMVDPNSGLDINDLFMYSYSEIIITGLRDDYSVFEQRPTLEEYGNMLIANSGVTSQVEIIDGLTTFTYYQLAQGDSYTYIAALYEGSEAFWMVQAGCKTMNFESAKGKLLEILKTVQVA